MILKDSFGSVRPYTRHTISCPHRHNPEHNACRCPKWLYEYRKGQRPKRYSLTTPSWVEAQRIASKKLRGFDPEIAEARSIQQGREQRQMSVHDACQLWIVRTEREFGSDGTLPQYKSLMKKMKRWAREQGIEFIQEITALQLEAWYSSVDWVRHADTTRKQRWGVLRSMFAFLHERGVIEHNPIAAIKSIRLSRGHVQGPFSDQQVSEIFQHLRDVERPRIHAKDADVYAARLNAFLMLLLHTGCDLIDAVLFNQEQVKHSTIDGREIPVRRYYRQKTQNRSKVLAVIPLTEQVAQTLRDVPVLDGNPEGMPFRSSGSEVRSDVHLWSRRIARLLKLAGIQYVELPDRDSRGHRRQKKANAKQFRHTFAVRQLRSGQRPEEVAKMLGHVDTAMIRKHYAPWVRELDEAHIRTVIRKWDEDAKPTNRRRGTRRTSK